jgi:hypothetical protein
MTGPVEVRFFSMNLTPDAGANDSLVDVRVVPAGREGTKVKGWGKSESNKKTSNTCHFPLPCGRPARRIRAVRNIEGPGNLAHRLQRTSRLKVNFGIGETGVGAKIDARDLALISRHDRLQNRLPSVGAVNVARTQGAAFQIAELVEHE